MERKNEKDYTIIKVPKEFGDAIEEIIKKYPELGYTSITEYAKRAIRDFNDKVLKSKK